MAALRAGDIVDNERVEILVRTLARRFVAFGGVPLLAVFDRPRTLVKSGLGREFDKWNPTFARAILELSVRRRDVVGGEIVEWLAPLRKREPQPPGLGLAAFPARRAAASEVTSAPWRSNA